jgi:hypothetical protein
MKLHVKDTGRAGFVTLCGRFFIDVVIVSQKEFMSSPKEDICIECLKVLARKRNTFENFRANEYRRLFPGHVVGSHDEVIAIMSNQGGF